MADRYAGGDLPAGPALTLTSPAAGPADGGAPTSRSRARTDGETAYVNANGETRPLALGPDGSLLRPRCRCTSGSNQVTVVAQGADGGTTHRPAHGHLDQPR